MFRDKDGWRVQWRHEGRRYSKQFDSKSAARLFEAEMQEMARSAPEGATHTFSWFADFWMERWCKARKAESQWVTDESMIRIHLKPVFGELMLGRIKKAQVEQFALDMRRKVHRKTRRPLSVKTVNLVLALLKKILTTAVKWGYLRESPAAHVDLFPAAEQVVRYWTAEERDRFLRFARHHDPAFAELALVACYTGLRRGELAGLELHQVDFENGVIRVDAVYCFKSGRRIERTKNRKIGWVPMLPEVQDALKDRRLAATDTRIFSLETFRHASQRLRRLAKTAGVRPIRFHDLRHTFASTLVTAGADLYSVQKMMRHETLAMTQRYAHLNAEKLRAEAMKISMARSPARRIEKSGVSC